MPSGAAADQLGAAALGRPALGPHHVGRRRPAPRPSRTAAADDQLGRDRGGPGAVRAEVRHAEPRLVPSRPAAGGANTRSAAARRLPRRARAQHRQQAERPGQPEPPAHRPVAAHRAHRRCGAPAHPRRQTGVATGSAGSRQECTAHRHPHQLGQLAGDRRAVRAVDVVDHDDLDGMPAPADHTATRAGAAPCAADPVQASWPTARRYRTRSRRGSDATMSANPAGAADEPIGPKSCRDAGGRPRRPQGAPARPWRTRPAVAPDYDEHGVPSFDYVRDKIESRYATVRRARRAGRGHHRGPDRRAAGGRARRKAEGQAGGDPPLAGPARGAPGGGSRAVLRRVSSTVQQLTGAARRPPA